MTGALSWLEPPQPAPLLAAGAYDADLAGLRYDGLLGRVPGGRHAPADVLAGPEGRAAHLRVDLPPAAAVARAAAAWVHTGRLCPERTDVVVAPHRRVHAGVPVHRQVLPAADVVLIGGVPTTTPLRTAVDLLCFADEAAAVASTRSLLLDGLTTALVEEALRRPARRLPVRRALRLLAACEA